MSMNDPSKDDAKDPIEQYLRGFRPVAPQPLKIPVRRVPRSLLAVAAGILLIIGLSVVLKRSRPQSNENPVALATHSVALHQSTSAIPITFGRLNQALRVSDQDLSDQDLNQVLDSASPRLLPHEHQGTVLFELSRQ